MRGNNGTVPVQVSLEIPDHRSGQVTWEEKGMSGRMLYKVQLLVVPMSVGSGRAVPFDRNQCGIRAHRYVVYTPLCLHAPEMRHHCELTQKMIRFVSYTWGVCHPDQQKPYFG
jgi:hypothetical protein